MILSGLSTSWWPSGIVVAPDGALTVTNLRGRPLGPEAADTLDGDGVSGHTRMRGSVEQIPAPTTAASAAEKRLTDSWDFSEPDEQPGLGEQVTRWMRGKQLEKLSPRQEGEVQARMAQENTP